MNCLRCNAPIELSAQTCGRCGAAVDANQNGMPDAIEKMIEDKARAMIDADRERQERESAEQARLADERQRRAQADAAARAEQERIALAKRQLQSARGDLEAAERAPRPVWSLSSAGATLVVLLAIVPVMPASCIGELATRRPMWGDTLCPHVCGDCTGPGRVFSWSRTTNGRRSGQSRAICHNSRIDIDTASWMAFSDEDRWTDIALSGWWRYPLTFVAAVVVGLAFMPFYFARRRRRERADTIQQLHARIQQLERSIPPDVPGTAEPYR